MNNLDSIGFKFMERLIMAFVQGAQWWEYHQTQATMWQSDRNLAEHEAEKRAASGTLGIKWEGGDMKYAAVRKWKHGGEQVVEYFPTLAKALEWIAQQPADDKFTWCVGEWEA